ncbi:MAG: hypothetical protein ACT4QD_15415 [Acidobacteriota bacterium]
MNRLMLAVAAVAVAGTMALAQGQTISGTLIDNACFNPKMTKAELAAHSKDCALMDGCFDSGYAVVTADGHAYKLDAKGNTEIIAKLKASNKASDLRVTVTGAVKDGTIAVSSIALDQ